jgi:hypothetical protein
MAVARVTAKRLAGSVKVRVGVKRAVASREEIAAGVNL